MSRDQARTALRVASVSGEEFEAAVEGDDPSTLTKDGGQYGTDGHRMSAIEASPAAPTAKLDVAD
jgi:hypothetical protein